MGLACLHPESRPRYVVLIEEVAKFRREEVRLVVMKIVAAVGERLDGHASRPLRELPCMLRRNHPIAFAPEDRDRGKLLDFMRALVEEPALTAPIGDVPNGPAETHAPIPIAC